MNELSGWLAGDHILLSMEILLKCQFTELFLPLHSGRHEDGTVRFWDASGVALTPIYKLSTANVFHTDCDPCDDLQDSSNDADMQQEEEWPPFRKVRGDEADGPVMQRLVLQSDLPMRVFFAAAVCTKRNHPVLVRGTSVACSSSSRHFHMFRFI